MRSNQLPRQCYHSKCAGFLIVFMLRVSFVLVVTVPFNQGKKLHRVPAVKRQRAFSQLSMCWKAAS
jgi:hypothetical protein